MVKKNSMLKEDIHKEEAEIIQLKKATNSFIIIWNICKSVKKYNSTSYYKLLMIIETPVGLYCTVN